MTRPSRVTTATAAVLLLAAAPEVVVGVLMVLVGLPFAIGLGVLADHASVIQSIVFGLAIAVPGALLAAFGALGASGAFGLITGRRWSLRASLAYAGLLSVAGLALITFGDRASGMWGSLVLAAGTVLLSMLPLPSVREDLTRGEPAYSHRVKGERRAL